MQRKKVLYVDPMCYKAHSYYNRRNIELLSQLCQLSVLFIDDYLNLDNLNIYEVIVYQTPIKYFPEYNKTKNYLFKRVIHKLGMFKIMSEIKKIIKQSKYDLVIFSACDIVAFSVSMKYITQNIAVIHHGIYRAAESKLVMHYLTHINHKITFLVFEDFIKKYLTDGLKIKNAVKVLHHPLCSDDIENVQKDGCSDKIRIFAPSHANSQNITASIVEKSECFGENIFLCIRGNKDYLNDQIKMYSAKYLPREEYIQSFQEADFILIPYDINYNYRISGILFDSLVRKKRVILFGGNTLKYYAEKYPNVITVVEDVDEFFNYVSLLTSEIISEQYNEDFYNDCDRYVNNYSDNAIMADFRKLLEGRAYDNY